MLNYWSKIIVEHQNCGEYRTPNSFNANFLFSSIFDLAIHESPKVRSKKKKFSKNVGKTKTKPESELTFSQQLNWCTVFMQVVQLKEQSRCLFPLLTSLIKRHIFTVTDEHTVWSSENLKTEQQKQIFCGKTHSLNLIGGWLVAIWSREMCSLCLTVNSNRLKIKFLKWTKHEMTSNLFAVVSLLSGPGNRAQWLCNTITHSNNIWIV